MSKEQKVTSKKQQAKGTSNEQKVTSNKQKLQPQKPATTETTQWCCTSNHVTSSCKQHDSSNMIRYLKLFKIHTGTLTYPNKPAKLNSLLVARCSLLFVCYSLVFARCLLHFARCSLLFAHYSLLFPRCSTRNFVFFVQITVK